MTFRRSLTVVGGPLMSFPFWAVSFRFAISFSLVVLSLSCSPDKSSLPPVQSGIDYCQDRARSNRAWRCSGSNPPSVSFRLTSPVTAVERLRYFKMRSCLCVTGEGPIDFGSISTLHEVEYLVFWREMLRNSPVGTFEKHTYGDGIGPLFEFHLVLKFNFLHSIVLKFLDELLLSVVLDLVTTVLKFGLFPHTPPKRAKTSSVLLHYSKPLGTNSSLFNSSHSLSSSKSASSFRALSSWLIIGARTSSSP